MKTPTVLAVLALSLIVATPASAPASPGTPASAPVADMVDNGLITLPEAGSPFIAFNVWVKAGSQDDPEGKEGLAALTASLLDQGGTRSRSVQEIMEALYPMAAGYSTSVDKEMTILRGVVHRDNLDAYWRIFSEAVLAPAFNEDDFARVKSSTMNYLERSRRYSRDEELSKELLYWMAYRGTPYEHPEEGYVESVASITLDDVKAFYRDHYLAGNVVVGIGGGYPEGFAEQARAAFDAALPAGSLARVPASIPTRPNGVKVLIVEKQTDATAISLGFPTDFVRGDPDFMAMKLVNSWFGQHRNSFAQLYQVIRERRGMNYGDYSYIEPFPLGFTTQQHPVNSPRRSNLFEVWIRPISMTEPGNLHDRALFATRAALRELHHLVENGLPTDQVDRTKNFLHNFSVTYGSTVGRRLAFAVDDAFFGMEPGYLASIRPGLAELNKAKVDTAIRRHLRSGDLYVVFITADAQAMKDKLLSGVATPITYAGEQPAEIVAEDRDIASWPIPVRPEDITIMPIQEVFQRGN